MTIKMFGEKLNSIEEKFCGRTYRSMLPEVKRERLETAIGNTRGEEQQYVMAAHNRIVRGE